MLKNLVLLCLLGLAYAGSSGYVYRGSGTSISNGAYNPIKPAVTHHHQTQYHQTTHHSAPQTVEKSFYYFTAPQEKAEVTRKVVQQQAPAVKKNLQVIFIKAPEDKTVQKAAQHIAQNVVEEKTHIYVLNKEPDHKAIAKKIQTVQQQTVHHKPEVHFIKYNTPEEAHHAQHVITQQYESLGGKSTHVQGNGAAGNAPVTASFISSVSGHHNAVPQVSHTNVNRAYLAPAASSSVDGPVDKSYAKKFAPSGVDVVPGSSYLPLRT